ncbi:superoxide dismutase family protein [Streptomyces sp. ME19-01-6]|uniref:superoxide dismutase family protein n=1 Tax=Streptomyces sp. ME19-01-6 TaxID=3028686 RepID=UPI0029B3C86F|nr:superoxide dismutase family protein [Streptomyces sp. ME19-01-6]MDX3224792.1 superoxide dismutase family protein [Streptomyces sp. ME19-01-6]
MSLAMAVTAAAAASMVAASPAVSPPCPVALVHAKFAQAAEARTHEAVTYNTKLVPTSAVVVAVQFLGKPRYGHEHGHRHEHYRMHGAAQDAPSGQGTQSTPTGTPSTPSGTPSPQGTQGKHEGTSVMVWLHGAKANHTFGVHVHTKPCGTMPDDSGPHYQNMKDPKQPSTNPKYANPHNEVWLDLTTDKYGDGHSVTHVNWRFRDSEARSIVIHEHATATQKGKAGMAGARVACIKVPFKGTQG